MAANNYDELFFQEGSEGSDHTSNNNSHAPQQQQQYQPQFYSHQQNGNNMMNHHYPSNINNNNASSFIEPSPQPQQPPQYCQQQQQQQQQSSQSSFSSWLQNLARKYSLQQFSNEIITSLEGNRINEQNLLFLDKETLVEMKIPVGDRVSLLKVIENENNSNNRSQSQQQRQPPPPQYDFQQHQQQLYLQQQGRGRGFGGGGSSMLSQQNFGGRGGGMMMMNNNIGVGRGRGGMPMMTQNNNYGTANNNTTPRDLPLERNFPRLRGRLRADPMINAVVFESGLQYSRTDWIVKPLNKELHRRLVEAWAGQDPWEASFHTCQRCFRFATKVKQDGLFLRYDHKTEDCSMYHEDGSFKKDHLRGRPEFGLPTPENLDRIASQYENKNNAASSGKNDVKRIDPANNNTARNSFDATVARVQADSMLVAALRAGPWSSHKTNFVKKPQDPVLYQHFVEAFGGEKYDPWRRENHMCQRCFDYAPKVQSSGAPYKSHHPTERCNVQIDSIGVAVAAHQEMFGSL